MSGDTETMSAHQVYEQAMTPLPTGEKVAIARLIMDEIAPDTAHPTGAGFDHLKRLLPQIERITLTDQGLAGVALSGPKTQAVSLQLLLDENVRQVKRGNHALW